MNRLGKTVLIAGATGYLGRHLIGAYSSAGYRVIALARRPEALISMSGQLDEIACGDATRPDTLIGIMDGVDLVVSALGITRQKDGLSYEQVDYQANRNLLDLAQKAGVRQFLYVHVKSAEQMPNVAMAAAKARFAAELEAASIQSTIICPSGFFSDLAEVLDMARKGRVYLFGNGKALVSPIDGHDLAQACVAASEANASRIDVGGPQALSLNEIAETAFTLLGTEPRITHIPALPMRAMLRAAKWLGLGQMIGAVDFFVAASQLDMSAPASGSRTIAQFFADQLRAGSVHVPSLAASHTSPSIDTRRKEHD